MISIITPTIRKDGLEIVRKALKRQTFKDFTWYIGSPFDPAVTEAVWVKDDFRGGYWTLNRIYNKLVQRTLLDNPPEKTHTDNGCDEHIIVSLQDNIWIDKDGLEKFYTCQQKTGGLVSGVGDQYAELNEQGKPQFKIWNDPRKTDKYGTFYECMWNDLEFNWCAFPRRLFLAVGGMDEQLDFLGYGGDQLQLCERLNDYGAKFYLDQTNESYTLRHDRSDFGGERKWNKDHVLFSGKYQQRKQELIQNKLWPILQTTSKPVIEKAR